MIEYKQISKEGEYMAIKRPPLQKTAINFSPDVKQYLMAYAITEGKTFSSLVREILREFYDDHSQEEPLDYLIQQIDETLEDIE